MRAVLVGRMALPLLAVVLAGGASRSFASSGQAALEAARAAVATAAVTEVQRQAANAQLEAAEAEQRAADALAARLGELKAENAERPARMAQLQAALQRDPEQSVQEWARRLSAEADDETLERLLGQERAGVMDLQAQIDAVAAELGSALSRPARAAGEIAALRRRVEELSLPVVAQEDEPAVLFESRRLRRASELRRAQTELDLRVTEQDAATQRQRQLELTLRELRHRLGESQRRVELLQQRIADLGRQELLARVERLAEREQQLAGAAPLVALAAAENRALGDQLIENDEQLARERRALVSIEEERAYVSESLRDSRARLEVGGASAGVGRWLWSERRRLEPPARLRQQLQATRVALADLRLRLVTLTDQQQELADVPKAVRALRDASESLVEEAPIDDGAEELLPPLLRERAELLVLLRPLLERRIAALEQSERALQERLDATVALQELLDRHLLWLPSHEAVEAGWLRRVPDGLRDLVKPSRFVTTFELCVRNLRANRSQWIGSLLAVLVLLVLSRRARAQIELQGAAHRRRREESYRTTVRALAWTILGALPAPAALALLGYLLQQVGSAGRYSDSLGRACVALAVPLFTVQVLRWSVIDQGLAHAHFRWTRERRETLRRWLPIAAATILPMYFVVTLASLRRSDLAIDVQARLGIVASAGALAWVFWHMLGAGRLWVLRGVGVEPSAARVLLRYLLPVLLLVVAVLALAGYVHSASVLLHALLASISLIVAVAIALGMLARWFLLGEQRLALRRQEERRAVAEAAAAAAGEALAEPEAEITLEQIGTQTTSLLRALRVSLVTLGLIWVWADVLPAIYRLDEIAVWHFRETGPDGAMIEQPVTLAAILVGAFALALTTIGSRNLPGLIEISLLSRAGLDAASRYAITSVLRYAIVIGGTLVGLSFFGLRWSQLQWMAAALTVGLGFGLQEIFANFVSGLILLFERPFRVGDVITVGDLSGRVTRIRTRATTILDFDNKEIVMPNKTFITGHLTNWGLSDTTTRVIIRVGVAYGTDPATVRELLLRAAAEEGRVVADPEPSCWFLAFGASSLDFELRVFVGSLGDRLEVQNSLNTRINQLFAEHEVEIAFPQLDLHVRDAPPLPTAGG